MIDRRQFVTASVATTAMAATARSYTQILGANDQVRFATAGLRSRGYAHLSALNSNRARAHMAYCCDVDSLILAKYAADAQKQLGYAPTPLGDFRRALEAKDCDAISIATPDHWHAPMAIMALQAGKHVYVEKPSSYNPREGELLIAAQQKYKRHVQVGDQQRSAPHTIRMIQQIHEGLIGRAYFAKAWYSNTRKPIGIGKVTAAPATLNWDLWQGPAPRAPYKDNIHPYNWHWLFPYGTGEALNNGTHEVDICRWALDVGYPDRITTSAGRYAAKDDWQFPDTMVTSFEYPGKLITWEGKSCNGMQYYGRDRGITVHGTTGSVLIDRGGYEVCDLDGKVKDTFKVASTSSSSRDLTGRDSMTDAHFANLIAAIRDGERLNSPIEIANVCVTMLHVSNIAWSVGRELRIDARDGSIQGDAAAMKQWSRTYEPGWEVRV